MSRRLIRILTPTELARVQKEVLIQLWTMMSRFAMLYALCWKPKVGVLRTMA